MNAIVIDTEMTGLWEPEVIEMACTDLLKHPMAQPMHVYEHRWKPSKPITLGALAVHHIMDEDLADEEPWPGTIPLGDTQYLIGHNIDADWKAIGKPNVKRICTLAFSRWLWPDLDSHTLSAMTYFHNRQNARHLLRSAHNAAADVKLCVGLFNAITHELMKRDHKIETFEDVHSLSEIARVPIRIPFGKYGPRNGQKGMLISEMKRIDPRYVDWLLWNHDGVREDPYIQKALRD